MTDVVPHRSQPLYMSGNDIWSMAEAVARGGMFGIRDPNQVMSLMLLAQAEGLHPGVALRDYHVIQGRPTLKADAMIARFQQAGGKIDWHELTDERVSATFTHPQGGSARIEWDKDRVKQAGIKNDMHSKFPRQMLRSRVASEGVRTVFPGVVIGLYTPEEASDMEPRNVTPLREAEKTPANAHPRTAARHAPAQRALAAQREENGHSDDPDDLPPEPPRYDLADLQMELEEAVTTGEVREVADRLKVIKSTTPGLEYEAMRQAVQRKGSDLRAAEEAEAA